MLLFNTLYLIFHLFLQNNNQNFTVYVAKIDWHVGIIITVDENSLNRIDALRDFRNYKFVDIGWGDSEFYQGPSEFDLYLASKAILMPTPSVVRIQGYNRSIEAIADWRDYLFKIQIDSSGYEKLCAFIHDSFQKDDESELLVTSEKYQGNVKFYSSIHKYHLLKTCNTWVAEALDSSGLDIDPGKVITADHLFEELLAEGKLIKHKKNK